MFLYKQLEIYHRAGSKSRKVLQDSQSFYCKHNEILYVGYNSSGRKTASVQKLIDHKLIRIYRVEKNRTDLLVIFPVAIVWSIVARQTTVVAFSTICRMAVCPS